VIVRLGVCLVGGLVMAVRLPPGFRILLPGKGWQSWPVCLQGRACLTGLLPIGACGPNDKRQNLS